MCIFSADAEVAETRIFARISTVGHQFLAYAMKYSADTEMAMILPLPVPAGAVEDALRFIDLSGYPKLFDDLEEAFPALRSMDRGEPRGPVALAAPEPLKVHGVGSFEASFVPSLEDFSRLDRRFRLPPELWNRLPRYADYGFAVFKLKSGQKKVHPMAFEFPTRFPGYLFFPTVHVHDGKVADLAEFDHALFCQAANLDSEAWEREAEWFRYGVGNKAKALSRWQKSKGMIATQLPLFRQRIYGRYSNSDVTVPVSTQT